MGRHGAVLGASWAVLGRSWGPLRPSWSVGKPKRREPPKPSKPMEKLSQLPTASPATAHGCELYASRMIVGISWEASRGHVGGSLEASREPLGGLLGASWGPLGASCGPLGSLLGLPGGLSGPRARNVRSGPSSGPGAVLEASWAALEASWVSVSSSLSLSLFYPPAPPPPNRFPSGGVRLARLPPCANAHSQGQHDLKKTAVPGGVPLWAWYEPPPPPP